MPRLFCSSRDAREFIGFGKARGVKALADGALLDAGRGWRHACHRQKGEPDMSRAATTGIWIIATGVIIAFLYWTRAILAPLAVANTGVAKRVVKLTNALTSQSGVGPTVGPTP